MNPETRGRTSTVWTASKWPVNSSQSVTSRSIAGATVTSGAGMAGLGLLQDAASIAAMTAMVLVWRVVMWLIWGAQQTSQIRLVVKKEWYRSVTPPMLPIGTSRVKPLGSEGGDPVHDPDRSAATPHSRRGR